MNNFNSFFNSQNIIRGASPFATAGASFTSRATTSGILSNIGRNKITLSGILNGAQKTIGTVNQVVPLYNQIKPMIQNSKVILNVFKGFKTNTPSTRRRQQYFNNNVPVDVTPKKEKIPKEEKKEEPPNGNTPSQPFFI